MTSKEPEAPFYVCDKCGIPVSQNRHPISGYWPPRYCALCKRNLCPDCMPAGRYHLCHECFVREEGTNGHV